MLDRYLVRLSRHESVCRLHLGRLGARLLDSRGYHGLGFARLTDYAIERILLYVKAQGAGVPRHRNPIHEREGWRCRVPACNARRNLQEHHVLYRSRGGGHGRGNRISICAWHHLHGIHTGVVRAHGDGEQTIHWR